MSINQMHGARGEDFVKTCGHYLKGVEALVGNNTNRHDIPAEYDPAWEKFPTSVKVRNDTSNVVGLADAALFAEAVQETGVRLMILSYCQTLSDKEIYLAHEMILRSTDWELLYGKKTLAEIQAAKSLFKLKKIPLQGLSKSGFTAGKKAADAAVAGLREGCGLVRFNPKIGRGMGHERRLQSSIHLSEIWEKLKDRKTSVLHEVGLGERAFPWVISNSTPRENAAAPKPVEPATTADTASCLALPIAAE